MSCSRLPDVNLNALRRAVYMFAFVFFVFMLFVTGGILESYRQDRRLTTGEFFAASGAFFWRFVRLALLSIIPFVIVWHDLSRALASWPTILAIAPLPIRSASSCRSAR